MKVERINEDNHNDEVLKIELSLEEANALSECLATTYANGNDLTISIALEDKLNAILNLLR